MATVWESLDFLEEREIIDRYLGDIEVNKGHSGGPVYLTESASLIGLCISHEGANVYSIIDDKWVPVKIDDNYIFYNAGLTTIIPSRYIIKLLEKNNVSWTPIC